MEIIINSPDNPVFFHIFNYPVRYYGVILSIAILVGILLSDYLIKLKYDKKTLEYFQDSIPIGFIFALFGARLFYVAGSYEYYLQNPSSDGNQPTGYLYVLRSKSNNQALQQFMQTSDLLKIGFCSTTVAERIANAKNSPTYLCSEVEVCQTYKCTGEINPHKVERLVHALLNEHRLNITLKDHKGQSYRPQEWFTVPLQTVEQIIAHILDGTIQNYRVDPIRGKLVKIKS